MSERALHKTESVRNRLRTDVRTIVALGLLMGASLVTNRVVAQETASAEPRHHVVPRRQPDTDIGPEMKVRNINSDAVATAVEYAKAFQADGSVVPDYDTSGQLCDDKLLPHFKPLPVDIRTPMGLLWFHNAVREAVHVPPLELSPELSQSAQDTANYYTDHGIFAHLEGDKNGGVDRIMESFPGWGKVGENIVRSPNNTIDEQTRRVVCWFISKEHIQNAIDPRFDRVGFSTPVEYPVLDYAGQFLDVAQFETDNQSVYG